MFSLFAAVLLVGCGSGGGKITQENYDKIKEGMSRAEVVAILGEPTGSEMIGQINDTEVKAPIWQGRGMKILLGFDEKGKVIARRLDKE